MPNRTTPVEVLLVEDNPGDIRLVREALRDSPIPLNLTVAQDGQEALDVLFRVGPHSSARRPQLILLDLNLPKRSGHEVLKGVKEDAELRTIPVVIVSSTGASEEVLRAYRLSANCYVRKPVDLDTTLQTIRDIFNFWFDRATLPA